MVMVILQKLNFKTATDPNVTYARSDREGQ